MKKTIETVNKKVFELAQEKGVSVYDICYHFVPKIEPPKYNSVGEGVEERVEITQEVKLVPLEFEFEKGPGYWKGKYYRLKEKMKSLIDNKED